MKKGLISILITIIGFYSIYRYNTYMYENYQLFFSIKKVDITAIEDLHSFRKLFRIVTISVGLLSFYLGIISFLKKNKIGLVAIILVLLLLLSCFIPFWQYV